MEYTKKYTYAFMSVTVANIIFSFFITALDGINTGTRSFTIIFTMTLFYFTVLSFCDSVREFLVKRDRKNKLK